MAYLAVALAFSWIALVALYIAHGKERASLLSGFAAEREVWVRERRDLNNRIQIPEAAPYLSTEDGPSDDDLPTLPGFTMTEEEREKAMAELEEAGYSEGPVA